MAAGGHFGFWLLRFYFSKYPKELKSSVKPYYALGGHGEPQISPNYIYVIVSI